MNITISNQNESITLGTSPFGLVQDVDLSGLPATHNILDIGRDGGYYVGTQYNVRDIQIIGYIDTYLKSKEWIQKQKELLYRICNPKALTTIKIENESEDLYLSGYAVNFPIFQNDSVNQTTNFRTFLLQITCPDPYIYREKQTRTFATIEPLFEFPIDWADIVFGEKKLNLIDTIYNGGIHQTPLDISIKANGNVVNPYLLNVDTQEKIQLNTTLLAGDVVDISTGTKKKVYRTRNGIKSVFFTSLDMSSVFLTLYQGDNVLRFGASSGEENMEVYIHYQERLGGI